MRWVLAQVHGNDPDSQGPALGSSSSSGHRNGPHRHQQHNRHVGREGRKYPDRLRGSGIPQHLVFIAPDHCNETKSLTRDSGLSQ